MKLTASQSRAIEHDGRNLQLIACAGSGKPTIHDGDYLALRANPACTRQRKIVLAQYRGPADPETGGSFTVKRYTSEKERADDGGWRHTQVTLSPTNREFQPIVLTGADAEHVSIVAEFVTVLRGAS